MALAPGEPGSSCLHQGIESMSDKEEVRPRPGRRWSSRRSTFAGGFIRRDPRQLVVFTRVDDREIKVTRTPPADPPKGKAA